MVDKVRNYRAIREAEQTNAGAGIQQSIEGRRKIFVVKNLSLTTARDQYNPETVDFNFRTFWVLSASDATASVSLVPNSRAEGQLNDAITLKQNLSVKLPFPVSGAQLYWSAQSGKTMTVLFFIDGDITPGSQINQISGGVAISTGSSRSDAALASTQDQASVSVAASATLIVPADSARIGMELQVTGGNVRLGGSAITTTNGVARLDGERWEDQNTGALYAIATSGAPVITGIVYK